jgi:glycosyltransferase involved in cell wall biosynthesis
MPPWRVAVILPPREGFGPHSAGAIALLQARLGRPDTTSNSEFETIIVGASQVGPLFPLPYRPVAETRWPLNADARYAKGVRQVLASLQPDLVEVHNKPDLAARLARWFPPGRIALFLHNDPRRMRGASTARDRARLSGRLGRIVCVSEFLAGCWMEGVTAERRPAVQPNCLDLAAMPEPLAPAARDRMILFAGRVVADKGADSFVAACAEALPQLPDWRAAMIGADRFRPDSPETPFTERLRPAAASAGISLIGYQDHAAVMAALSRAAIAVVPSRWQEPFGLAALEAMASGAALVTTRRGGLAGAIIALANDPAARAYLGQAGRDRARAYDLPEARRRLDQLRTELLTP